MEEKLNDLPENVRSTLTSFVETAQQALGPHLVSTVLFGSAAEGRLRISSDVNLILVLKDFSAEQIDGLRENLRMAHAAINLNVMFLLESELPFAAEAFAVKFSDIVARHRVLTGSDPFASMQVSREATIRRLNQVLVNLMLRLRERYAMVSLREEHLANIIADAAGPIRASASTILALEGQAGVHPKEALEKLTEKLPGRPYTELLRSISVARDKLDLKHGEAAPTLLGILDLLKVMHKYTQGLRA